MEIADTSAPPPAGSLRLDEAATVLSADERAMQLYGLDQRVVGQNLASAIEGDTGPLPWKERIAAVASGGAWSSTEVHRVAGDHRVWVRATLAASEGQPTLTVRAASGLEVVSERGPELTSSLAGAVEQGGIGIWLDDVIMARQQWSTRARELFALPDGPVNHERFFERVHPEDRAALAGAIQTAIVQPPGRFRSAFRIVSEDGGERHVETFGTVLHDHNGQALLALGGAVDRSEPALLASQVEQLQSQLQHTQRLDALGRLAGGVAHDFNNLLTVILGNCELLLLHLDDLPDAQKLLTQELEASERGSELTQQLLAYTRRQPMELKPIAFDAWVRNSSALLKRLIEEDVSICMELDAADAFVSLDRAQMFQVLSNLVSNGAQAMADGGTITVRTRQRTDGAVELQIEDEGVGISREVLPHIFEPFFTTKQRGSGTGLGLSTVQGIVEQLGGRIEVSSSPGKGARFTVTLPVADDDAADSDAPGQPALRQHTPDPDHPLTVLVVEDQGLVRTLTSRILETQGYRVLSAQDGVEALALLDSREIQPDLLLTDVVMPRMDGPALASRLRASNPGLRVAFMSGYPAGLIESRVGQQHREPVLKKPFKAAALLDFVDRVLVRRAMR